MTFPCRKRFQSKWNLKCKRETIKHNSASISNSFPGGISIKSLCVDVSRWCIGIILMMCSYIMASDLYAVRESLNTCLQEMHWVNLSRLNTHNFTCRSTLTDPSTDSCLWMEVSHPYIFLKILHKCVKSYLWEFVPQVVSRRVSVHVRHQVILQTDRDRDQYWKRNKLDLDGNGELGKPISPNNNITNPLNWSWTYAN